MPTLFNNQLYTIFDIAVINNRITAKLELHPEHPIFAGHFPQQPVLPGVTLVQAVGDTLGLALGLGAKIFSPLLDAAPNIKFTNIVNPLVHKELQLEIITTEIENGWKVDATASRGGENCLKLKAVFQNLGKE